MSQLINGKSLAGRITEEVRSEIENLGTAPGLAVVLVGDDEPSHLYVGIKEKACAEVGIRFEKHMLPADTTSHDVLALIKDLNQRDDVDAILIQLPLPDQLDTEEILSAMDPNKDVDGFHSKNVSAFLNGDATHVPVLVGAVMALIAETRVPLDGLRAAVVANSEVFAEPLMAALEQKNCSASFFSAGDNLIGTMLRDADIVIVAAGRPGLIQGPMLKPGCIVIDIGTNRVGDKLVGDCDADSIDPVAAWRTPVPGGVGPVTVAMLLRNTVELAK